MTDADRAIYRRLGATVRQLREERGLTVEQLAERCSRGPRWVQWIESAFTSSTLADVRQLGAAFGLTAIQLLLRAEAIDERVIDGGV